MARKKHVLDYDYPLEVAPFTEKLELLMWLHCPRRPYKIEDGELRIRPPHQHDHLKSVRISRFFGHKDQVELALHILRSSIILEKLEISKFMRGNSTWMVIESLPNLFRGHVQEESTRPCTNAVVSSLLKHTRTK